MKAEWKRNLVAASVFAALVAGSSLSKAADDDKDLPNVNAHATKVVSSDVEGKYTIPADGQVWLYDANDKTVEHSISVRKGNTYAFNVKKSMVYVDGKMGAKVELESTHTYRIYFVSNTDRGGPAKEEDVIPANAKVVAEGKAKNLIFTNNQGTGHVYLWDTTTHELVNTFHVKKPEVLAIEPGKDRIVLDDKVIVKDAGLKADDEYKLLFDLKEAAK